MIPWVLGVDPGTISGWGLLDPAGRAIASGQTGRAGSYAGTGKDVLVVLRTCWEVQRDTGNLDAPIILAIEGQFLKDDVGAGEKDRFKAVGTLKTARHAGIWIGVCEAYDVEVYQHKGDPGIQSQVWRGAVWGGRWRKNQAKTHAVKMAKATWGVDIPATRHHEAEALWIAKYVSDLLRMKARQQGIGL